MLFRSQQTETRKQTTMTKDLTISNIERQNILNNRLAIESVAEQLSVPGMLFEGEYRFTKSMVAEYYEVDHVTDQVIDQATEQVKSLLSVMDKEHSTSELMELLNLSQREHFRKEYLQDVINLGLVELTKH